MPFFSVLMPTRNRASLLKSALKTAVDQNFQDYEIIVSDNNSQDDTRSVVEGFMQSSDRIKYVNPGRDLSMCDNWEYVLSHAAGDYIIYLSDDDALTANSLFYVHELLTAFSINVLVWEKGFYQHPDVPDDALRCNFSYDLRSGNLYEVPSRAAAEACCNFDGRVYGILPKMLNCVVSGKLIRQCQEKTRRFFVPPYPDYSAACQLLGASGTYHLIDLPLYICGVSRQSNAGIQYDRKQKCEDYLSLFDEDLLEGVPYPMRYLTPSYFLATYHKFQKIYPDTFGPVNMDAYLKAAFAELMFFGKYEDVSDEVGTLAGYMRTHSGGDEMFNLLTQAHATSDIVPQAPDGTGDDYRQTIKGFARKIVSKSELTHNLARKAKRILRPLPPVLPPDPSTQKAFSHSDVATMFEASRILSEALSSRAKDPADLKPFQVETLATLELR